MIDRKSWRSDAPSTRAASSRSRSTEAIPVRAERMKNGADTNVWARITATVVNGIAIPSASNGPPSRPRRPRTIRRASPATDGGRTIGRSITASSQPLPGNARRARIQASGRPKATVRTRLTSVVARLRTRASRTTREVIVAASDPSSSARPTRARTGSPRKSAVSVAGRGDRSLPPGRSAAPAPGGGERRIGGGHGSHCRCAASSITTAAGTRSRRESPGRRARRASPGMPGRRPRPSTP